MNSTQKQALLNSLKVGDKIKIKPFHYRAGYRTCVRKIKSIENGNFYVTMFGWPSFKLHHHEIIEKVSK